MLSGFKALGSHWMRRPSQPQQPQEPEPTIELSEWSADGEVQLFECYDLHHESRVLAVTPGYLILLQPASPLPSPEDSVLDRPLNPSFAGPATIKLKKQLGDLKRITSNKEFPGLLSFQWRSLTEDGSEEKAKEGTTKEGTSKEGTKEGIVKEGKGTKEGAKPKGEVWRLRVINFAHCIEVVRLQVQTRKADRKSVV